MHRLSGTIAIAGLGLTAAFLSGGCYASVNADVPNLEVTWHDLRFPGAPDKSPCGFIALTSSYELSSSNLGWASQLNTAINVARVRMGPASGTADLTFIQFATVTMVNPVVPPLAIPLMSYDRTSGGPAEAILETNNTEPIDVSSLWTAGRVRIDVTVAGVLPAAPWSVDVTLDLSGTICYKL
jgi:hypothetical protein